MVKFFYHTRSIKGKDQTNLAFSYERNEAIGAGHSNSIQIKFSKPLGKAN